MKAAKLRVLGAQAAQATLQAQGMTDQARLIGLTAEADVLPESELQARVEWTGNIQVHHPETQPHQCESWQMRRRPEGGRYCAACGKDRA